ncbi:hypothetical protein MJI20_32000, partial [Salmonella enterica subsp. enterica serovar Anatum]|nr:hypothetical protein [Salmonella enterica subsp. enterica serovar Anatum]
QKLKNIGEQIDTRDSANLRKYSILGALTLYLDFINLFLMLLRVTPRLLNDNGTQKIMLNLNIQDGQQSDTQSETDPLPEVQNS